MVTMRATRISAWKRNKAGLSIIYPVHPHGQDEGSAGSPSLSLTVTQRYDFDWVGCAGPTVRNGLGSITLIGFLLVWAYFLVADI